MIALCFGLQAEAQTVLLKVTGSPNPVVVSNLLTFTIHVTNVTGIAVQNIVVTNTPPSVGAAFISASGSYSFGPGSNSISLNTGPLNNNTGTNLTLTIAPLGTGTTTNFFSASTTNFPAFLTSTNVLITVAPSLTNLVVGFADFPPVAYTNDLVTYRLTVTNSSALQNFVLTNVLPAGVKFISATPAPQSTTSNRLVFPINTSATNASFQVTIQPTNTGVLTFSAFIDAVGLFDTNNPGFSAVTNLTVNGFSGTLIATNVGAMQFDPQTGLMDQTIRLVNIGGTSVGSARVIVSGLSKPLFNAVGTNNGKPFVVYGNTLNAGANVDLVLEFFIPTHTPITISNSQYTAVGIDPVNVTVANGTNGTFQITKIVPLVDSSVLIEFQSITNGVYTILYSDDTGSTWLQAQPAITSHANRTQWIDDGPPKTISFPSSRLYRAFQSP